MRHALLLATALFVSACATGSSSDDAGKAHDLAAAAVDLGQTTTTTGGADLAPQSPRDLASPTGARDLASPSGTADLASAPDLAPALGADLGRGADLAAPSGDGCFDVTDSAPTVVATAASSDEFAFTVAAQALSATSWAQVGNEALVLDVLRGSTFVGNLVLHQGATSFTYGMNLGALVAGDSVALRVSALSAAAATKAAHVCAPTLTSATQLGAAGEGLVHAPVFLWPVKKSFDDLPMVLGWSKSTQQYVIVYTNENGGTAVDCGGGAAGVQAEYARWGRGCDIETIFDYSSAMPEWLRCTGEATGTSALRFIAAHPVLYYGDGHNRVFESRGGYGQTCGTAADDEADGAIVGWNTQNPGNDASLDAAFVITVRPLPFDLDAIGFTTSPGRREALVDKYAPWLYGITDSELHRENKVDGAKTMPIEQYLFVDVYASDVGGSGDKVCALSVSGGFVLRLTTTSGTTINGPQMTATYFGGSPAWKRLAIPLDRVYQPSELSGMIFDAYDNDGIYFLSIGDAFMARHAGDNSATLSYVRQGQKDFNVYVDDNNSSCVNGVNSDGPNGLAYPCAGSAYSFTP